MKTRSYPVASRALAAILSLLPIIGGAFAQDPPAPAPVGDEKIEADTTSLIIEARGLRNAKPPLFFSATTDTKINVSTSAWQTTTTAKFNLLQGEAGTFSLKLIGGGDVTEVKGKGILDWAVRRSGKDRFLDIRANKETKALTATIIVRKEKLALPCAISPATFAPGAAVGFSGSITVIADPTVDLRIAKADGLSPAQLPDGTRRTWKFHTQTDHTLHLSLTRDGAALAPVELVNAKLDAAVDTATRSATFILTAEARVTPENGGSIDILSGHAAVTTLPEDPNFSLHLHQKAGAKPVYRLKFSAAGNFPVRLEFQAGILGRGGWDALDFTAPAGAVVPITLNGFGEEVRFDSNCPVFPTLRDGKHVGFLPAGGHCNLGWQTARDAEEGKLFFSTSALVESRVGAGLLRQQAVLKFNILQGKLDSSEVLLEGAGEILSVEGANLLSWAVEPGAAEGQRLLKVQLSRPATGTEQLSVRSQTALGEFPLEVKPMRFTPQGAVRHSGQLQVLSDGAVALEVSQSNGLIQMAPGKAPAGTRQVFLYRFPSAQHDYTISARQVLPEVTVSQTTIYQMTETDRVITGKIEIDIAKAPLREWEMRVPSGYAVVDVRGAVARDFIFGDEADADGRRPVKILFSGPTTGRQLIEFRLERNLPAAAGDWQLPPLAFPGSKSVRGSIGVATVAGYRATPGTLDNLSEIPQNHFPLNYTGLQQTFRQRETEWSATVAIEALPQSVQADVFHLYSLKEGIAYGSMLVEYSIIGSPVSEWRFTVPAELGNLAVESQNVQSWRREEEELIVTLHQPVLGESTVLLTFEQTMDARDGLLKPGQVAPIGVQGERGHIQVVSPSQVRQEIVKASDGLLKMEASELPPELQPLAGAPSLAVYQYTSRPFDLQMKVQWFEPGETVAQVVDYANMRSHVASDGQVVTHAEYFVKTRGRKALRLKLDENSKLWESRVNGITVAARTDGSETLIPLPANIDPSTPVRVYLRTGQKASDPKKPTVSAPVLLSPTLINSWKVAADPEHRLVPIGDNIPQLITQIRDADGFNWLRHNAGEPYIVWLAIILVAASLLCCCASSGGVRQMFGLIALLAVLGIAIYAASTGSTPPIIQGHSDEATSAMLEFVTPVIESGEAVNLTLQDTAPWQTLSAPPALGALILGAILLLIYLLTKAPRWVALIAWALIAFGMLRQPGGAPMFFAALSLCIFLHGVLPVAIDYIRSQLRNRDGGDDPGGDDEDEEEVLDDGGGGTPSAAAGTALALLSAIGLGLMSPTSARAQDNTAPVADTLTQKLKIEKNRLYGELEIGVSGTTSDTVMLLRAPAILTEFQGEGLRVTKRVVGGKSEYWIVLERDGASTAKASYELALPADAVSFKLPTGAAAVQKLNLQIDQAGWQVTSPNAVKTSELNDLPEGASGAEFILAPAGGATIAFKAKSRDLAAEQATFFAEVGNLFIPGPGIVDGRHKLVIRPSRGQLRTLDCSVPDGFTVSEVTAPGVSNWRFDPDAKSLRIDFNPPASKPFEILVLTQSGSGSLPADLELTPLTVAGAQSQIGTLAIAFGPEAQAAKVTAEGLSIINQDDFDRSLVQPNPKAPPLAELNQAYRFGAEPGSLKLTVAAVAPEVRAITQQTLSLGEERMVLAIDLGVDITRSGIFKLSFPIPDGLDIEAASGDSLANHTESNQDGVRIATLQLKGRTIGQQRFAITLAGASPDKDGEWEVPRFSLREAPRQTGQLLVVPEQGIRTGVKTRKHVTQLDARKLSQNRPGTLAFRLLQSEWELALQLEKLAPWITARLAQNVTAREGITRTNLAIDYKVENAAVKSMRVQLPGLGEEEAKTVRASGQAVSHIAKIEGAADLWEVHFQRRILGGGKIAIDYQRTTDRADGIERIHAAKLPEAKYSGYWVGVRVSGHLEVAPSGDLPRGWQPADWSGVPKELHSIRTRAVPDLAFRASDPEEPLTVKVQRHQLADTLRLSVLAGEFTTAVAPDGAGITEARLKIQVVEKSTLRVALPAGATLINTFVNGQSPGIVREESGEAYLFYVLPREDGSAADVTITWSMPGGEGKRFELKGPKLNIPLQNITWYAIIPDGLILADTDGNLEQVGEPYSIRYDVNDYIDEQTERFNADANAARRLMEQAYAWKDTGDQEKARSAFSQVAKQGNLDQATNEDARVQLRKLQEERVLLSLTTRRQRNYLDNRGEDPSQTRNASLEQAAGSNPYLQGKTSYLPDQRKSALSGNTSEETDAFNRITARLVSQQLAAEPAPQAIEINIPKHGQVLTFKRSVQVDGGAPLELDLKVTSRTTTYRWLLIPIIAAIGLLLMGTRGCRRSEG